nr:COX15/CtaA family protein [Ramlibacter albus]
MRKLAWACAVLVLAITSLSAFIRLSRAGIGCEPWPQCHEQRTGMTVEQIAPLDTDAVHAARIAHRIAASVALLLIIAMLVKAWATSPTLSRQGREVGALLGVALFLAVLGRLGADSRSVWVAVGNLAGGLVMFALSCRLVAVCSPAAAHRLGDTRVRAHAAVALALVLLQVVLGGVVSASNAGSRCDAGWLCDAHWTSAALAVAVLVPLAVLAWRAGARAGIVVALLVLLQAAIGVAMMSSALALPLAMAHNLVAALLLAGVAVLLAA